jgi:hypothetical protein
MTPRQTRSAIKASKKAMEEIDGFIMEGKPLRPFAEAILLGDAERAYKLAPQTMIRHNLIPELSTWASSILPPNFFLDGHPAIRAWMKQKGFEGASDAIKVWLYMYSNHWDPKKRPAVEVHA